MRSSTAVRSETSAPLYASGSKLLSLPPISNEAVPGQYASSATSHAKVLTTLVTEAPREKRSCFFWKF